NSFNISFSAYELTAPGLLRLFELDVIAHVLRNPLFGHVLRLADLHLALARRPRTAAGERIAPETALRTELLLHLSAHLVDAPAEHERQKGCEQQQAEQEIEYEDRNALQHGGRRHRENQNHEARQR